MWTSPSEEVPEPENLPRREQGCAAPLVKAFLCTGDEICFRARKHDFFFFSNPSYLAGQVLGVEDQRSHLTVIGNRVSKSSWDLSSSSGPFRALPNQTSAPNTRDSASRQVLKDVFFHPAWSRALPTDNPLLGIHNWDQCCPCLESTAPERRDAPGEEAVVSKLPRDHHRQ